ncbi:HEAT repeat protein [Orenia metallireducens]|uniref:HEAT repeat-containing protein n=1 Tax=Orenia metallireducens TaxID=1413210 RepID=A0A285FHJ7_9FIRM|nr:HEAT repeat domain-containing protein [Orenia metallireducens]PRX33553.1 HEAT repeat protein [Orenia metallireducens]SNY10727.1 HEAT repeat-containing protein [Orenia metallireducens]
MDKLDNLDIKQDLINYGKKDLYISDYLTVKDYLVDDKLLKKLLMELSSKNDIKNRKKAGLTLLNIGTSQAINYVTCLLYDEDKEVKITIIKGLSEIKDNIVITILINYLEECDDMVILEELRLAFLRIGDRGVSELLRLLDSDNDIHVKWAVKLLTKLSDERVIKPFMDLLYNHKKAKIRVVAAIGLSKFKSVEVFEVLVDKLNDTSYEVRAEIVSLLGNLGNTEAIFYLDKMLRDENVVVRNNTCQALLKLGKEGIKQLILATEKDDYPNDISDFLNTINAADLIKSAKELYGHQDLDDRSELNLINFNRIGL